MNNLLQSIILMLTALVLSNKTFAQQIQQKNCISFFENTLQGIHCDVPEQKFHIRHLNTYRDEVWNCWIQANQRLQEPGLPLLDSLNSKVTGHWTLPSELEPHATLPFYWGYKGDMPTGGYPLFLYLHGSGPKEQEWKTGHQLALIFNDAPSIYFIPQIPNEGSWYRWWQKSKQYAWNRLLRKLLLDQRINPNRLYIFGISEGGYGAQRLASFYADYWAAAGPMAGGEPLRNAPAENLSNIGFSLRTGNEDYGFYRNTLTRYTHEAIDSLQQIYQGLFRHQVELIPHQGHHIDYRPTTPWLKQFERNPWPKTFLWEDYEMDGIHRKAFYNIYVNKRPCDSLRTRYNFNIQDNTIYLDIYNIVYETTETDSVFNIQMKFKRKYTPATKGHFTLFLNEHLVDLNHKVKIIVNGKVLYNKKPQLNIKNLLQSTSIFYDPERIYPASVEIRL